MTDPRTDLEDIIDAAEKIERFTNGMSYEAFVEDEKTVDAVLRNFEVMGEATKNLPESFQETHDHVPWTEMAGMRDRLIQGYATVDLEIIWTTIQRDIPEILTDVRSVMADLDE
jgi:uncharacterized protein with HEPN domain